MNIQIKRLILITVILSIISCSPRIGASIINKKEELGRDVYVLVIPPEEIGEIGGIKIGEIKSGDSGFSSNCSYNEIIEPMKNLARQNGANIIKITKHSPPDMWSTCDRLKADIYYVDDYRKYQRYIEWGENRRLTWEDFKGTPNPKEYPEAAALTNCGFGFQSNRVNLFKRTKIFVENTFDSKLSWVLNEEAKIDRILAHEQAHFDLSEIYARTLRLKLKEQKLTVLNIDHKAKSIFDEVYRLYLEKQELYDSETEHGINQKEQLRWEKFIAKELGMRQ